MKIIGDDIDTVKYILKQQKEGKPVLDPYKKKIFIQGLKEAPKTLFTESWYWLLAIVFVFAIGFLVGLNKGEVECNNFIYRELGDCIGLNSAEVSPGFTIFPGNISQKYGEQKNYSINGDFDIPS